MSAILTVLLLLAVLGGVGAVYYFMNKKDSSKKKKNAKNNNNQNNFQGASITIPSAAAASADGLRPSWERSNHTAESPSTFLVREPTLRIHDEASASSSDHHHVNRTVLAHFPELRKKIASEICGELDCLREWNLVFSTDFHGRSMPRLTSALSSVKGPVMILIEEELVHGHHHQHTQNDDDEHSASSSSSSPSFESHNSQHQQESQRRNIFGGVTFSPWLSVKQREMIAKASAAARARAERTGQGNNNNSSSSSSRPANQAPQFFGDSHNCFLFKYDTAGNNNNNNNQADVDNKTSDEIIKVFKTRDHGSLANSNVQYYFDLHPHSDHVGIGMGGSGARSVVGNEAGMAWFIDRSLVHGMSCPGGCSTFQHSTRLSAIESTYRVRSMEVWSLNPDTLGGGDDTHINYATYDEDENGETPHSALHAKQHKVDMALVQLGGMTLYTQTGSEREDVCTE